MKTLAWSAGGLFLALVLVLVLARIVGFGPGPATPGLWLKGELVKEPVSDWTFAEKISVRDTAIQTRYHLLPFIAHSVRTGRAHYKDRLYYGSVIEPGVVDVRAWNRDVAADPHVRIKLADKLYDVKFALVTDPVEYDAVVREWSRHIWIIWTPGRYVRLYRVEPAN